MQVNDNGTATYFAVLEKSTAAQKERIEKKAQEKKAEKKAEARKEAKKSRKRAVREIGRHGHGHHNRIIVGGAAAEDKRPEPALHER